MLNIVTQLFSRWSDSKGFYFEYIKGRDNANVHVCFNVSCSNHWHHTSDMPFLIQYYI